MLFEDMRMINHVKIKKSKDMINKVEKVIEVTVERMASVCCHHKPSNKLFAKLSKTLV